MGATGSEVWVCGQCRSVNKQRESRCYACKTPRAIAAVDPTKLSSTSMAPVTTGPIGRYHSTIGFALLASLLILAAVAVSVYETVLLLTSIQNGLDGLTVSDSEVQAGVNAFIALVVVAALALLSWATWLSRAVANLPSLGVGFGRMTPGFVFVESLIPIYNVYRVHRIVADILGRIRPAPRDQWAIIAGWLPLVLSVIIWFWARRIAIFSPDNETAYQIQMVATEIGVGLQIVAALFLVALIWRVERRMRGRAAEVRNVAAAVAA